MKNSTFQYLSPVSPVCQALCKKQLRQSHIDFIHSRIRKLDAIEHIMRFLRIYYPNLADGTDLLKLDNASVFHELKFTQTSITEFKRIDILTSVISPYLS